MVWISQSGPDRRGIRQPDAGTGVDMLSFLWQHREKSPLLTRRWFKSWAKRAWTFPALLGNEFRVWRLRWRGARIGAGSVFSPVQVSDARQLTVKENSFIGRVFLQAHAKIQIGSYVCINDGARLITASHDVLDPAWRQTEGWRRSRPARSRCPDTAARLSRLAPCSDPEPQSTSPSPAEP